MPRRARASLLALVLGLLTLPSTGCSALLDAALDSDDDRDTTTTVYVVEDHDDHHHHHHHDCAPPPCHRRG
jgi:hypothetical protein